MKRIRPEWNEWQHTDDHDVYSFEAREELLDNDQISPAEEGFMAGFDIAQDNDEFF